MTGYVRGCGSAMLSMLLFLTLALAVSGCGSLSRALRADSALLAAAPAAAAPAGDDAPPPADVGPAGDATATAGVQESAGAEALVPPPAAPAAAVDVETAPVALDAPAAAPASLAQAADAQKPPAPEEEEEAEDYDPWEPFNEVMFNFNHNLDRFVLKPVAKVYNAIMPEPWQVMIANGFDNIKVVPRFVNSLLQAKWAGAGRELARFLINSTAGIGGLFDPAKDYWGIEKSREDFGQTLGVWGVGPGPYLVLPFLPPLTVRDGIGRAADGAMDPLSYFIPFVWDRLGMQAGEQINDRSLNLELFQGFEETVIDLYSAVRHGYLQRRQRLIQE